MSERYLNLDTSIFSSFATLMTKRINPIHIQEALFQLCVGIALSLYLLGSFPGESLHVLVHSKEVTELHSTEHEKDACHQTLFHGVTKNGCTHKTHFFNGHKCLFSQIGHQSPHLLQEPQDNQPSNFVIAIIGYSNDCALQLFVDFSCARAPPLV